MRSDEFQSDEMQSNCPLPSNDFQGPKMPGLVYGGCRARKFCMQNPGLHMKEMY